MRPDLERIDSEAADWFVRREAGLSPSEEEAYQLWLEEDPIRAERMRRHEKTWKRFGPLEESFAQGGTTLQELLPPPKRPLPPRTLLAVSLGLAAAIALFAFLYPRFLLEHPQEDLAYEDSFAAPAYSSRILVDGSIVELNRGARLRVRFTKGERSLWLEEGEAHFDVAKDQLRPFVVHAGGAVVRAVGTAFNVRLTDRAVEVVVTEGLIQFGHSESTAKSGKPMTLAAQLTANQQSVIPRAADPAEPVVESLSPEQVRQRLAWKPEILEFSSATLAQVAQAFNKRNETQLVIADPQLRDMPIEMSFRAGNVESFARLLELAYDIQTDHRPQSRQIVLTQRP